MPPSVDTFLPLFHRAAGLSELEALLRRAAGEAFGARTFGLFILLPVESKGPVFLVSNRQTLSAERHFELLRGTEGLRALLNEPPACRRIDAHLKDLIEHDSFLLKFSADGGPRLLAHGEAEGRARIAVLVDLPAEAKTPGPQALEAFGRIVGAAAEVAPRMTECELTGCRHHCFLKLQEDALRLFQSEERADLVELMADILDRHFGFGRILIALLHEPSSTLRCELHSGFGGGFLPRAVPTEPMDDFFGELLYEDRIVYLDERAKERVDLSPLIGTTEPEHGVVAPMKVETRTQGLIYADLPRHELASVFPDVLKNFIAVAATAAEALRRRVNAEVRAETDPLTGVYNRHYLDRVLEIEIPRVRRYKSPISLLMIDLCDFKKVNDTYGHVFGDFVLRETANLIRSNVREPDVVVRYGGDEFVVLMVNTADEQGRLVKERIERAFIERNRAQDDEKLMIDISIGMRSADDKTIETLLEDADRAMYEQKAERKRDQMARMLLGVTPGRPETIDKVVTSLLSNLKTREPWYPEHSRRVAHVALLIARSLEMPADEVQTLVLGALLHDVGKASLPTEVLRRPGPLTPGEYKAVQGHALIGEEFLSGLPHLEPVRPLIRHHHERWDGQTTGPFPGYPHGLSREMIPRGARILKLADSFDAMVSGRPWAGARPLDEVLDEVQREAGASFDPALTTALASARDELARLDEADRLGALYHQVLEQADQREAGRDEERHSGVSPVGQTS